jgi:undecaprenyl phosphate N,N'-diacetylbacillosamine 1-phosphate transferase
LDRWIHEVVSVYPFVKRAIDVLVSLMLIVVLAPVWLMAGILVKLTSPGPLFYVQTRGGRGGRPFSFLKFRTMRADHVHNVTEIVPLSHPAITTLGRILRRFKIDELPQLLVILRGDMSLIGPRPTIMEQVQAYNDVQRRRLEVRPGLTGLAQVNGNAAMSWDERIKYDVYYVDHCGALMDLMILVKTLLVIVLGEDRFARPFDQSPYAERSG